jgi:AraC-like DNA-binding protein
VSQECEVDVRFLAPPRVLRRYFTTFYHVEWTVPGDHEGVTRVEDHLLPEWGNLRFHTSNYPEARMRSGERLGGTPFPVTGPSSQAMNFTIGSSRMWGVGLLPLGWAKFVAEPAADFADRVVDGLVHPAFAQFRSLAQALFGPERDEAAEYDRIAAYFLSRIDEPCADEHRITAIHAALIDPEVQVVSQIVARAGVSQRTVERICRRAFGFSPKVLLRRQRFMRSLSNFMRDPTLKWIGAIDGSYHDQAQFVRDCRQFMGMAPSHYAALPKPLIGGLMRARERLAGSAAQTLDSPEGPRRNG